MNSRTDPGVVVVLVCNLKSEDEACQTFNSNPWSNCKSPRRVPLLFFVDLNFNYCFAHPCWRS